MAKQKSPRTVADMNREQGQELEQALGPVPESGGRPPVAEVERGPVAEVPAGERSDGSDAPASGMLAALADRLEALAKEAEGLGEATVAKAIRHGVRSAKHAAKVRVARLRRAGGLVAALKAQGLTAEEIVARMTEGGN